MGLDRPESIAVADLVNLVTSTDPSSRWWRQSDSKSSLHSLFHASPTTCHYFVFIFYWGILAVLRVVIGYSEHSLFWREGKGQNEREKEPSRVEKLGGKLG